jgi:hypothetical protein
LASFEPPVVKLSVLAVPLMNVRALQLPEAVGGVCVWVTTPAPPAPFSWFQ